MNVASVVEYLESVQSADKAKDDRDRAEHGAATFCHECGRNTFVGQLILAYASLLGLMIKMASMDTEMRDALRDACVEIIEQGGKIASKVD